MSLYHLDYLCNSELDQHYRLGKSDHPLILKYSHSPFWHSIKRAVPTITATQAATIAALSIRSECTFAYSRNNNRYSQLPGRYKHPLITRTKFVGGIDDLERKGLVINRRQLPGRLGIESQVQITQQGLELFHSVADGIQLPLSQIPETVIMRDHHRRATDYRDNRLTIKTRRVLITLNESINSAVDSVYAAQIVRIFNNCNFQLGGRYYAVGYSYQTLPKHERVNVKIDGESIAEIDFKQIHPTLLYDQAGKPMPVDCYDIDGYPRELIKLALMVLINSDTLRSAALAIAHRRQIECIAPLGSDQAIAYAYKLIAAVKRKHSGIQRYFHTGIGLRLQRIDSDISTRIIELLLKQGITPLPLHDSYLVPESKKENLQQAMRQAADELGCKSLIFT